MIGMRVERQTVDMRGFPDLVVVYLGIPVRRPRGLLRLLGLVPQIQKSWKERPDGLLLHEDLIWSLFPPHLGSATGRRSQDHRMLEFYDWPERSRVIVRRERPHPGAQLSFTDVDGHRFQATLTDLAGSAVELERLHRARANAEDRVSAPSRPAWRTSRSASSRSTPSGSSSR
jgi:hypothetical protein